MCPPQHHWPPQHLCPPVDQGGSGGQGLFHRHPLQSTTWMVSNQSIIRLESNYLIFISFSLAFLNRSSSKSQIPTPSSISRIPRRPGSTTPGAKPSSPATVKRAPHPPRAQSVDPYKMASHSLSSTSLLRSLNSPSKIKRPGSSRYVHVLAYIDWYREQLSGRCRAWDKFNF